MSRIVIVDGRKLVRDGLRAILTQSEDFEVVGEAADGREALDVIRAETPDVAIIDAQLPRLSGIELVRRLRQESSSTVCIVVSTHGSPTQVRQALGAGASGFLPADSAARDLVDAVRTVRAGRSYLGAVSDQVVSVLMAPEKSSGAIAADITARQREILQLIAEGLSTKEIATELGISDKTVETHRARLMCRLGIRKASSLVRYAIREGIVSA